MQVISHYALTASVIASAIGGVVLCLLLFLYGAVPPDEEPRGVARRRTLVTRLGHTLAAACFAVTAVLALVVVAREAGAGRPAGESQRLAEDVHALEVRVAAVESVVQRVAASLDLLVRRVEQDGDPAASARPARPGPVPRR
jgi:hypothetical protein